MAALAEKMAAKNTRGRQGLAAQLAGGGCGGGVCGDCGCHRCCCCVCVSLVDVFVVMMMVVCGYVCVFL